jgi:hypothetical protein
MPNPVESVYGLKFPHLDFMSNPDGYDKPVGPGAPELEIGLIVGTVMAALPPPRAKRAIAREFMTAEGKDS